MYEEYNPSSSPNSTSLSSPLPSQKSATLIIASFQTVLLLPEEGLCALKLRPSLWFCLCCKNTCCKTILLFKSCSFYLLNLFQVSPHFASWLLLLPVFRSCHFLPSSLLLNLVRFAQGAASRNAEGLQQRDPTEMGKLVSNSPP